MNNPCQVSSPNPSLHLRLYLVPLLILHIPAERTTSKDTLSIHFERASLWISNLDFEKEKQFCSYTSVNREQF